VLQPPRGFRDYLPEEWKALKWLGEKFLKIAVLWGYSPVEAPILEHLEILKKKAGPGVINEIYWFKDKAGRELGIRFDYTVPLARAIAARPELPKPIKWCYFGRAWRYDEPQAGRWREFWQFGVELVGLQDVEADAEIMALSAECLRSINTPNLRILVCDRRLVEKALESMKVPRGRFQDVCRIIDKRKKIGEEEFLKNLLRLNLPQEVCEKIANFSSTIIPLEDSPDYVAKIDPVLAEFFSKLVELLESYQVLDLFRLDCSIVRGLEYYTGLVFEAYGGEGEKWNRLSIGGGGRYDELIGLYRQPSLPATGFALGVDRIAMLLRENKIEPWNIEEKKVLVFFFKKFYREALNVANVLRSNNIQVSLDYTSRSIRDAIKYALKSGFRYIAIIGEREAKLGKVSIKDLREKTQVTLPIKEVGKALSA